MSPLQRCWRRAYRDRLGPSTAGWRRGVQRRPGVGGGRFRESTWELDGMHLIVIKRGGRQTAFPGCSRLFRKLPVEERADWFCGHPRVGERAVNIPGECRKGRPAQPEPPQHCEGGRQGGWLPVSTGVWTQTGHLLGWVVPTGQLSLRRLGSREAPPSPTVPNSKVLSLRRFGKQSFWSW